MTTKSTPQKRKAQREKVQEKAKDSKVIDVDGLELASVITRRKRSRV